MLLVLNRGFAYSFTKIRLMLNSDEEWNALWIHSFILIAFAIISIYYKNINGGVLY